MQQSLNYLTEAILPVAHYGGHCMISDKYYLKPSSIFHVASETITLNATNAIRTTTVKEAYLHL